MKSDHLNYSRQLLMQFKAMAAIPNIESEKKAVIEHTIDLCRASKKFLLPEDGVLLPDDEWRALDESVKLRLPYPFIALEFQARLTNESGNPVFARRVIFCREDEDGIYVKPAAWIEANGFWIVRPDSCIPSVNYLNRSNPNKVTFIADYEGARSAEEGAQHLRVVLGFLNALQCSNVHIQKSEPKKKSKKVKSALQFDTYHILTINIGRTGEYSGVGGLGHRSPREHLRRGHIVRPKDRKPFWRNATVVCAGGIAGKVEKDYRVRGISRAVTNAVNRISA